MEFKATCLSCNREFLLSQVGQLGQCPWCGATLAPQYTTSLVQTIKRVEMLGAEYLAALKVLAGLQGRFRLDEDSFDEPIEEVLGPPPPGRGPATPGKAEPVATPGS